MERTFKGRVKVINGHERGWVRRIFHGPNESFLDQNFAFKQRLFVRCAQILVQRVRDFSAGNRSCNGERVYSIFRAGRSPYYELPVNAARITRDECQCCVLSGATADVARCAEMKSESDEMRNCWKQSWKAAREFPAVKERTVKIFPGLNRGKI